jgi:hypothetical protein
VFLDINLFLTQFRQEKSGLNRNFCETLLFRARELPIAKIDAEISVFALDCNPS